MSISESLKHYGIPKEKITAIAAGTSSLLFATTFYLCLKLTSDYQCAVVYSLLIVFAAALHILQFYPKKFMKETINYTLNSIPVISILSISYSSNESMFKAIKKVANEKIPHISGDFRKILERVVRGESPRRVLSEYAERQPSKVFRDSLLSFLALTNEGALSSSYALQSFNFVAKQELKKLEVKITLFVTFLFFIPLLLLIAISLHNLPSYYLWLAPLFQVVLAEVFLPSLIYTKGVLGEK